MASTPLVIYKKDLSDLIQHIHDHDAQYVISEIEKDMTLLHTINKQDGWSLLRYSLNYKCKRLTEFLIANMSYDVRFRNSCNCESIIFVSVSCADPDIFKCLVNKFGNVNVVCSHNGQSPLFRAVLSRFLRDAETLLQNGADKHIKDVHGKTVTDYANELQDHVTRKLMLELLDQYD